MSPGAAADVASPRKRRRLYWLLAAIVLLLAGSAGLRFLLRPEFATGVILDAAGNALGLEITASGPAEYDIRGTPRLVLRGIRARQPGAAIDVLQADRLLLSVPWETLRQRGEALDVDRVELDAPVLDLAALQAWLRTRPETGARRLPNFERGLHVSDGTLAGDGWQVGQLSIDLPRFVPGQPLALRLEGRHLGDGLQVPFRLAVAMSRAAAESGLGISGTLAPQAAEWRLPMRLRLRARARLRDGGIELQPALLGLSARFVGAHENEGTDFALGAHGPARISAEGLDWPALALALRGGGTVPALDARGHLHFKQELNLALAGEIADWPARWPRLPEPLARSRSPLPFTLAYRGDAGLDAPLALSLQRDRSRFEGRLRLPDMLDWSRAPLSGSPLPPLDGRLVSDRLEIGGAVLEGVQLDIDDPGLPEPPP